MAKGRQRKVSTNFKFLYWCIFLILGAIKLQWKTGLLTRSGNEKHKDNCKYYRVNKETRGKVRLSVR